MKIFKSILFFLLTILMVSATNFHKPNLFIIGDSTVKNGSGLGDWGLWGWGDPIARYFDSTLVNVENHARGGTSSRTFRTLGLWEPVLERITKGDYVLMQFGHNDGGALNDSSRARGTIKGIGDETEEIDNYLTGKHEIVHSYGWYMTQFVREIKAKGGIPVIMSPIPRNVWKDGKVPRNNKSYGLWAKEVAEKENVLFIDLNEKLASAMEKRGEEDVTGTLFYKRDHTHTSAEGAVLSASLIVEGIKEHPKCGLNNYLLKNPKIDFPVKKTVFIIGDSTVASSHSERRGWGMYLPEFMDTTRIVIINKARGGRSSRTYDHEGLWNDVLKDIKKGDFVLMQFGHNDGGAIDKPKYRASINGTGDEAVDVVLPDSSIETVRSYGWYLRKYIADTKSKGAFPIVLSPVPRNIWKEGKVERANDSYGKWARESADTGETWFIDLNNLVAKNYEVLGQDSVSYFFPLDHTHTNETGARLNAKILSDAIKSYRGCPLRGYAGRIEQ